MDIWDEMMGLERRLDELFRVHIGERGRVPSPADDGGSRRPFIPRADVFVRSDECVIAMDLPGVDPDSDVELLATDSELIVRGERASRAVEPDDYFRREVSYGRFERRFALADKIRQGEVKASYKDGVLEIVIPAPRALLESKPDWRSVPISSD